MNKIDYLSICSETEINKFKKNLQSSIHHGRRWSPIPKKYDIKSWLFLCFSLDVMDAPPARMSHFDGRHICPTLCRFSSPKFEANNPIQCWWPHHRPGSKSTLSLCSHFGHSFCWLFVRWHLLENLRFN